MGRKNLGGGGGKGVNKESEAQLWRPSPCVDGARAEMSERAGVEQAGGQDRAGATSGLGCS